MLSFMIKHGHKLYLGWIQPWMKPGFPPLIFYSLVIWTASFTYVSYKPKFKVAIHLHLTPLMGGWASFCQSNHVYVNVSCPLTNLGSYSHITKPYTLNQIPHMHSGQLGTGSILFNIYVFFSRMIQKHPSCNFMLNMISLSVQEL